MLNEKIDSVGDCGLPFLYAFVILTPSGAVQTVGADNTHFNELRVRDGLIENGSTILSELERSTVDWPWKVAEEIDNLFQMAAPAAVV